MNSSVLTAAGIRRLIPSRPLDSYKGRNGHVLVVAGSRTMSGAAVLTGLGALRAGAGLVSVATPASVHAVITAHLPEALTLPLPESPEGTVNWHGLEILENYLKQRTVNVVALGPGLSVHAEVMRLIQGILKNWEQPMVLDADGLNNMTLKDLAGYPNLVITPHAMELSRLIGIDRETVKRERLRIAQNVAKDHELICVLKGHQTIITDGLKTYLNPTGNPAMATGGMGDILTGAIAALIAQGLPPLEAASAGVYLHGLAGDLAQVADRGLLARDVAASLPLAFRKIGIRGTR